MRRGATASIAGLSWTGGLGTPILFSRGVKPPSVRKATMRFTICTVRRGVALAGALLVLGTGTVRSQQQQGTIAGSVTDRVASTPLAGAKITVLNTNLSTITHQEGHYTLTRVPVGTYQLQAS